MSLALDCLRVLAWLVRLFCRRMWRLGFSYLGGRPALRCAGLPKGYAGDDLSLRRAPQTCAVSPVMLRKLPEWPYGHGITTFNTMRGSLSDFPPGGYGRGRALLLALGHGSGGVAVRPGARPVALVS
jgi:hypothetical protein